MAYLQVLKHALDIEPIRFLVKVAVRTDLETRVTENGSMIAP